ncbi:hypothetical protein EYS09_07960 [Streptomyces kasugaensis]|uniref:Uncharacterized protein n=1 Tax=Streptomyces kasugaensis TaxID=1946 RepID=A0A4V2JJ14_STRKA|nr:hypothetical protein EYS09_07960 [Streptomyces kasugaensis]
MTPATPAAVVFTDETLRKAADRAAAAYRPVWIGRSGEQSSGEAVARHLEATLALLDKDGWVRTLDFSTMWSTSSPGLVDVTETTTVKTMLKSVIRFLKDEFGDGDHDPSRDLFTALCHVGDSGAHGDSDTARIAGDVLDLVIRAHTGANAAFATRWSERLNRTHADITALLTAGAKFARTYGPGAGASLPETSAA